MELKLVRTIISKVFPSCAEVVREIDNVPPDQQFLVIPGKNNDLRWIVPRNCKLGLPVLKQWRAYDIASRAKWSLLLAAYRAGQLPKIPGIITFGVVERKFSDNLERLGFNIDERSAPVVYIGTPGPRRKAVATIMGAQSLSPLGVAKFPIGSLAKTKILREAAVLKQLEVEKPGLAPKLFFLDNQNGVSVQEMVSGAPVGRRLTRAHVELLVDMRVENTQTTLKEKTAKLISRIESTPGIDNEIMKRLTRFQGMMNDSSVFSQVWTHGDFAPWNLKWVQNEKLFPLDWEDSISNSIPMYDLFHYFYKQSHVFKDAGNVIKYVKKNSLIAEYMRKMDIPNIGPEKMALFYLISDFLIQLESEEFGYANFLKKQLLDIVR